MEKKTPEQIAAEAKAKIEANKKAAADAKANPDKKPDAQTPAAESSPAEKKPVEIKPTLEEAQKKAEADKAILEKADDQLSSEEKTRKTELLDLKKKADAEKEAKKSNAEKRIDELVGQVKALKSEVDKSAEDKKRIEKLEAELKDLREKQAAPAEKKVVEDELSKREKERIQKALAEDKSLPREERREMSKEELEAWWVEDPTAAQAWISERTLRRHDEKSKDSATLRGKQKADEIITAQGLSQKKVIAKHPDLDVQGRIAELKAQGKSQEEVQAVIQKENPTGFAKAKLISEILKEDEDKYFLSPNGPELLMEEMERRLKSSAKNENKPSETEEERDARIAEEAAEAERQRQANIDDPLTTTNGKTREKEESADYKQGLALYLKANKGKKTKADYDKILARRKSIPGAYAE